ncbi:hypothetical protein [Streptomyces sp. G45]|uniref:hypothetical protein n=1 Tax=Streptomyces sp. G45 TaxID=3406627 RepID=UPI003C20D6C9
MPLRTVGLDIVDLEPAKGALRRRLQLVSEGIHDRKVLVIVNGKGESARPACPPRWPWRWPRRG